MNHPGIPEWFIDDEIPLGNQKKSPVGLDHNLVELLWRNGQVVMHSQTLKKPAADPNEASQPVKHDPPTSIAAGSVLGNPTGGGLIQNEDAASWLNYPVVYDSFERELCGPFLPEIPSAHPVAALDIFGLSQPPNHNNSHAPAMPPPGAQILNNLRNRPRGEDPHGRECSVMTVGSSHCGSNQVAIDPTFNRNSRGGGGGNGGGGDRRCLSAAVTEDDEKRVSPETELLGEEETAATSSSSGRSGSSTFVTTKGGDGGGGSVNIRKRKARDPEESECQHDEADDFELGDRNKSSQKSGTTRRSRSAEVHNLSERRRRDRINEKMKALQELLPHSTKTDKASMLDEAIEYLKSLQMQLQMMWMGSGMASMMFSGVQPYMSRMGMGMVPPTMPSMGMHLPRPPMVNHSAAGAAAPSMASTPSQAAAMMNPMINFQNQMKPPNFPEQFAGFMGFHPMQNPSQFLNRLSLGSHSSQPNAVFNTPTNANGPPA
ncbi:unnamed protein product [Cuscuta epithymum]|uniref:BHLH domain-containing protein n=1 Tax=Cuscuta epithymum TaxID=186058 RepID=A0AAV0CCD0_9ASTE|nr:unnamed protein product [Cuscuta epithymum]